MDLRRYEPREAGVFKGKPYKGDKELEEIAGRVIKQLRAEGLPIWQVKEVLGLAESALDWEVLK